MRRDLSRKPESLGDQEPAQQQSKDHDSSWFPAQRTKPELADVRRPTSAISRNSNHTALSARTATASLDSYIAEYESVHGEISDLEEEWFGPFPVTQPSDTSNVATKHKLEELVAKFDESLELPAFRRERYYPNPLIPKIQLDDRNSYLQIQQQHSKGLRRTRRRQRRRMETLGNSYYSNGGLHHDFHRSEMLKSHLVKDCIDALVEVLSRSQTEADRLKKQSKGKQTRANQPVETLQHQQYNAQLQSQQFQASASDPVNYRLTEQAIRRSTTQESTSESDATRLLQIEGSHRDETEQTKSKSAAVHTDPEGQTSQWSDWETCFDPEYGAPFFINIKTNETQWDIPDTFSKEQIDWVRNWELEMRNSYEGYVTQNKVGGNNLIAEESQTKLMSSKSIQTEVIDTASTWCSTNEMVSVTSQTIPIRTRSVGVEHHSTCVSNTQTDNVSETRPNIATSSVYHDQDMNANDAIISSSSPITNEEALKAVTSPISNKETLKVDVATSPICNKETWEANVTTIPNNDEQPLDITVSPIIDEATLKEATTPIRNEDTLKVDVSTSPVRNEDTLKVDVSTSPITNEETLKVATTPIRNEETLKTDVATSPICDEETLKPYIAIPKTKNVEQYKGSDIPRATQDVEPSQSIAKTTKINQRQSMTERTQQVRVKTKNATTCTTEDVELLQSSITSSISHAKPTLETPGQRSTFTPNADTVDQSAVIVESQCTQQYPFQTRTNFNPKEISSQAAHAKNTYQIAVESGIDWYDRANPKFSTDTPMPVKHGKGTSYMLMSHEDQNIVVQQEFRVPRRGSVDKSPIQHVQPSPLLDGIVPEWVEEDSTEIQHLTRSSADLVNESTVVPQLAEDDKALRDSRFDDSLNQSYSHLEELHLLLGKFQQDSEHVLVESILARKYESSPFAGLGDSSSNNRFTGLDEDSDSRYSEDLHVDELAVSKPRSSMDDAIAHHSGLPQSLWSLN